MWTEGKSGPRRCRAASNKETAKIVGGSPFHQGQGRRPCFLRTSPVRGRGGEGAETSGRSRPARVGKTSVKRPSGVARPENVRAETRVRRGNIKRRTKSKGTSVKANRVAQSFGKTRIARNDMREGIDKNPDSWITKSRRAAETQRVSA